MQFSKIVLAKATLAVVISLCFVSTPASAQVGGAGNIVGRVQDNSGAVVPGVAITATESGTGLTRTVTTNNDGFYRVEFLPPGTYRLRVALQGFATLEQEVTVIVGQTPTINFTLKPATVQETVTVIAETPLVETTKSEQSGFVDTDQIENLPIAGRDFQSLAVLIPGVTSGNTAPFQNYDPVKKFIPAISINGQNGRNINMSIDGGDNNDIFMGGQNITLSQEAVAEFEIISQRHRAEYGKGVGGVINVITKNGTNNFHGNGFLYFQDRALRANDAISKQAGNEKPPFDTQQFGGTIGGPIARDKAFFFYSFERSQRDTSNVFNTGGAFAELDGTVVAQPFRQNMNTVKMNLTASESNNLFVRYSELDNDVEGELNNPLTSPESTNTEQNRFHDLVFGLTTVLGDTKVNDFRFHYARFQNKILNDLKNNEVATLIFPAGRFGASSAGDQSPKEITWEFRDDFSIQAGRHSIKSGGNVIIRSNVGIEGDFGQNQFTFANNDYDPVTRTIGPTNQALFLTTWSASEFRIRNKTLTEFGVYVQDDWTVNNRLTLNLGVRYDLINNLFYPRDVAASNLVTSTLGETAHDDKNNLAGRVGVAYDLRGDGFTVLRAGYGRYYDPASIMTATLYEELDRLDLPLPPYQFTFIPGELFEDLGIVAGQPIPSAAIQEAIDLGLVFPFNFVNNPNLRVASADQFNIGVGHQLTGGPLAGLALDASFVYSKTTGLNQVPRTPQFPELGLVDLNSSTGESEYKGFLFWARKRFTTWQFYGSYTLSSAQESTNQATYAPLYWDDPSGRGEFGPSNFDEHHRVVVSGMVRLPYGFLFSGVASLASARPYTAGCDCDSNEDGIVTQNGGTFNTFSGDRVSDRGAYRGDPTYNVDLRLSKSFPIGGEAYIEIIFDAFNVLNIENFGQNYFDNLDDPDRFGTPINIIGQPATARIGARVTF